MWALFLAQRLAAETAQRRLQSELHDLRHACDVEMHALRRQHQIAEDKLQREVLARQAAEQELLHAKRAQESADEAAQKARLYSSVSLFFPSLDKAPVYKHHAKFTWDAPERL